MSAEETNADRVRVSIFRAAAMAFAENADATVAHIGELLNMRKSVVHYYLRSKADLIRRAYEFLRSSTPKVGGGSPNIGFEITVLSAMRQDAELREIVKKAWEEERRTIGLFEQATEVGLQIALFIDPTVDASAARERLLSLRNVPSVPVVLGEK